MYLSYSGAGVIPSRGGSAPEHVDLRQNWSDKLGRRLLRAKPGSQRGACYTSFTSVIAEEWGAPGRPVEMRVRVQFFGRAASQSGVREAEVEVASGATLREVAAAVIALYPALDWIPQVCRPARNLEYGTWSDPVADGDEVSFIPPVSGG